MSSLILYSPFFAKCLSLFAVTEWLILDIGWFFLFLWISHTAVLNSVFHRPFGHCSWFLWYKNKKNHPMSSNSHPSMTANKSKHLAKKESKKSKRIWLNLKIDKVNWQEMVIGIYLGNHQINNITIMESLDFSTFNTTIIWRINLRMNLCMWFSVRTTLYVYSSWAVTVTRHRMIFLVLMNLHILPFLPLFSRGHLAIARDTCDISILHTPTS